MAHLSEVAFWGEGDHDVAEKIVRSVAGSIALLPDTLIVMESTADGDDNYFHTEWQRAVRGESDKEAVFVPWYEIEIYRKELADSERREVAESLDSYEKWLLGLDGVVAIGGDGTFRGALALSHYGIPVVGVPATIDNDIGCSHYTIGFDTACNTAIESIDKLRDTMQSHERCSVVEVMGRHAGYLALYVGIAVGATAVLIPERQVNLEEDVVENIRRARLAGTTHYMVVVAEGAGSAIEISQRIHQELGIDPRVTVLGHIQRGGSPTARDRETASRMGYEAVKVLAEGTGNQIIGIQNGLLTDIEMEEALAMTKPFQMDRYQILEALTNSCGPYF